MALVDQLRRVGAHPLLEPYVSRGLRARLTTEPARFFARDAAGRGTFAYTTRETGQRVTLEHGTSDVATFTQTYYLHDHEPPPAVLAAMTAAGRPLRVLDVGANIGMWTLWLATRLPIASVTAIEPVTRNVGALRANLAANLPAGTWTAQEAAAATRDGQVRFGGGDFTTGRVGAGSQTVRALDVFGLLDGVDLLKLDVEGEEWTITADPRWETLDVPFLMFEHHPHSAPADAAGAAEAALEHAGYEWERVAGAPDGTGVLWGRRSS